MSETNLAVDKIKSFDDEHVDDSDLKKFTQLAEDYVQGKIDILQIANNMGSDWTENKVIILLELLEANRPLPKSGISNNKKRETLSKLLKLSQEDSPQFKEAKYVEAEVLASQRLEGIHVSPDAFIEEY